MHRFTVRYERDPSGWWIVTIPQVQGCRTQGRSIAEGRRRIREALALFIPESEAECATLLDDVRLSPAMRRTIRRVAETRRMADRSRERAQEATRDAVEQLTRHAGLSVRDAAEMLGLSHQRVQQLSGHP
jgi:predicted RNase H-like HicB family nuclease